MGRLIQTIALLTACLGGMAAAEIPLPWEGMFCDTSLPALEGTVQKSVTSQSAVYGNYRSSQNDVSWEFAPRPSVRLQPHLYLRDLNFGNTGEEARDMGGRLSALWKPLPQIEGELFLDPRRFQSRSGTGTNTGKIEENYSAGVGARFWGIPHSIVYLQTARLYAYNQTADTLRYHNSGWAGYTAGATRFSFRVLDSLGIRGDYARENRDLGFRVASIVQARATLFPSNRADTLFLGAQSSQGEIQDHAKSIYEQNSHQAFSALFARSFSSTLSGQVLGRLRTENRNFPDHPIQDVQKNEWESAAHLRLEKDPITWNGIAGWGMEKEDRMPGRNFGPQSADNAESQRNLQDNRRQTRWAEGEVSGWLRPNFRAEWHGFAQLQSTDYDYFFMSGTDTIANQDDNDFVTLNHRMRGVYWISPRCSLSLEGQYSEFLTQYIRAASSGANLDQNIYSLVPAIGWKIQDRIQGSHNFEMLSNYSTNPFFPSRNTLYRQFRNKTVFYFSLTETDTLRTDYEIRLSDQGSIDSVDYYGIRNKNVRHEWNMGWIRRIGTGFLLRPTFGQIISQAQIFADSSQTYQHNNDLSGNSWVYSLGIHQAPSQHFFLSGMVSYMDDSKSVQYWNANLSVRISFL